MTTMHEVLSLSCGHSVELDRPYSVRGASAGDVYRCKECGEVATVLEQVALSR